MGNLSYELKLYLRNSLPKLLLVLCLAISLIVSIKYLYVNRDKRYFKNYVTYEESIDRKQQVIMTKVDADMKEYYNNKRSKAQIISNLNNAANDMENLYDSFKWKKGDEITKELFTMKKQIIITYAQIYKNRARAFTSNVDYNEAGETDFVSQLTSRYIQKDRYQRMRYKIQFKT